MCDVYLLHFDPPLAHAQHYLGSAIDVQARIAEHLSGQGSPLVRSAHLAGCSITLARVWSMGGRELEAKFKRRQHNRALCPLCSKGKP